MSEKMVENLVYALSGTVIVADKEWAETLPDWIRTQIKMERMAQNILALKGKVDSEATDAEVVAYLYTLSLKSPMTREAVNVYEYLVGKYAKLPEGMGVSELDEDEKRILQQLKSQLYKISRKSFSKKLRQGRAKK